MARVDNRGNLRGSLQNRGTGALGVRGAEEFLALSKRLKAAGETELRKDLHKAVRQAGKPLPRLVKDAARENLPTAGGLNRRIAGKSYRVQARTGARTAGVRVVGSRVDPRINAEGRVYHPIFGRKGKAKNGGRNSVVQRIPEAQGYFDETLREAAPAIREDVVRVVREFTDRLAKG